MSFKRSLLAFAVMGICCGNAFAASTAELVVHGTIIPGGCTPTFASGGVVDFGKIAADSLNPTAETTVATKRISYSVSCSAPMKIALGFKDNRAGTGGPNTAGKSFGLGTTTGAGATSIGFYHIHQVDGALADSVVVDNLVSDDYGATWRKAVGDLGNIVDNRAGQLKSFASSGATVPLAASIFSGNLDVQVVIYPTSGLDVTQEIPLDGSSTLEVFYL